MFSIMVSEPRQKFVFWMTLSDYEKLRAIAKKESEGNLARLFRQLGRDYISKHKLVYKNDSWECLNG